MQVRTGRAPGRADIANHVALVDLLAFADVECRKVAVAGFHVAAVLELDEVAVAAEALGHLHISVGGRVDRRAGRHRDVDAVQHLGAAVAGAQALDLKNRMGHFSAPCRDRPRGLSGPAGSARVGPG